MSDVAQLRRGRFIVLAIFVGLASIGLAWFCGHLATLVHGGLIMEPSGDGRLEFAASARVQQTLGPALGAATGLIAAAIWCWVMFRAVWRGEREQLVRHGARVGLYVGLLATILLHTGLSASDVAQRGAHSGVATDATIGLAIGLLCAAVSGVLLGAICGALCRFAARRATPPSASPEPPA